jgi:hypothetical protein
LFQVSQALLRGGDFFWKLFHLLPFNVVDGLSFFASELRQQNLIPGQLVFLALHFGGDSFDLLLRIHEGSKLSEGNNRRGSRARRGRQRGRNNSLHHQSFDAPGSSVLKRGLTGRVFCNRRLCLCQNVPSLFFQGWSLVFFEFARDLFTGAGVGGQSLLAAWGVFREMVG